MIFALELFSFPRIHIDTRDLLLSIHFSNEFAVSFYIYIYFDFYYFSFSYRFFFLFSTRLDDDDEWTNSKVLTFLMWIFQLLFYAFNFRVHGIKHLVFWKYLFCMEKHEMEIYKAGRVSWKTEKNPENLKNIEQLKLRNWVTWWGSN